MRRLWYNGTVASMDGAMRRYEAVGAEDGRLTFLGSVQEALAQEWDETRDLQGAMVLPGFTDSHMHLLHYAMIQKNLSLFGVASIGEIIERGRARIERDHPSYLIGMGWNQETMVEGRLVTREDLDRISTDIPVCMLRTCLHIGACNSVMLERIRALEDVAPEVLALVDFANGILREDAARLYMKVLPQADDAYVKELIRLGQRDLNAAGITCVNSDDLKAIAGVDPIRLIGIFREMEADGELTVRVYEQCLVEPEDFERLLRPNTKAVVCTHGSNLTGDLMDIQRVGNFCQKHRLLFILDASQTAGVFPIDMERQHISVVCFTGHKSLMGPQGTGGLCVGAGVEIRPFAVGGTGVQSYSETQPEAYPTRLEAGTLNSHGIAGLGASLAFLKRTGRDAVRMHESVLARRFYETVRTIPGVKVYGNFAVQLRAPIVSLNIADLDSSEVADELAERFEIATRPGAHCAPRLHRALGTEDQGAVRFSWSYFNTEAETDAAAEAVRILAAEAV